MTTPPARRRPRRATVEPTRLNETPVVGVFERAPAAESAAAAAAPVRAAAKPVLDEIAAADDPRAWGDPVEDLGDWLKSQRPPHWE